MTDAPGAIAQLNQINAGARGVIGALAQREGQMFGLTARHLVAEINLDAEQVRNSIELIGLIPLPLKHTICGTVTGEGCADPDRLLGESVYRFCPDGMLVPGKVTVLHGAVSLRKPGSDTILVYTDVVEVTFDAHRTSVEHGRATRELPPLGSSDPGTLVFTPDYTPVGIIVAGSGYRACVAPLRPFLEVHRLTLVAAPAKTSPGPDAATRVLEVEDVPLVYASMVDDLAREESLDLGTPEAL